MSVSRHTKTNLHSAFGRVSQFAHLVLEILNAVTAALQGLADLLMKQLNFSEIRQVRQQVLLLYQK